jgi:hypothetical protein
MGLFVTKEAIALWGIRVNSVHALCNKRQVEGADRLVDVWVTAKVKNWSPRKNTRQAA